MQLKVPDISIYLEPRALSLEELESLVCALDTPATQIQACAMLHELAARLQAQKPEPALPVPKAPNDSKGLRLYTLPVPDCPEPVRLILHPAVFEPEHWGMTFAEGLLKQPEIFDGKSVVELGTGSGWISILLLKRTFARQVVALDLNPQAVAIARLNVWLNGSHADGRMRLTPAGLPLPESVRVAHSDLLQEPLGRKERFDHVIGCIPQVLHPDPGAVNTKNRLSARDLYDLSNYCFQQGILEDRFGLPLIARALEQAQLCLNHSGLLTLILGGRPGQEAIDGVFRRRGYEPKLWWSRRIHQADDTDLASLVALEKEHGIKFHFFVSNSSKQSIPASTAVGLLKEGRALYHDLLVIQAQTRFEKPMLGFVRNINALGLSDLRKELDLTNVSEEQISFLERLTSELLRRRTLPYPHERGDASLREKIAYFLRVYCTFAECAEDLFVGPERAQLLSCVLSMLVGQGDKVLLSHSLSGVYGRILNRRQCQTVLGNDDLYELMDLDNLFQPKICLLAPREMTDPSPLVLQTLIQQAQTHPDRWYVIDDSANFDIASELKSNVSMRILAQHQLPPNLVFLHGLVKNTVCPDLELSFMINAPDAWIAGLDVAAELTYSRIAYPTQLYYEWLFDELLSFPFPDNTVVPSRHRQKESGLLSPWFKQICADPVFADKPVNVEAESLLRLDYGEFEAPVPGALVKGLIKGFLEPQSDDLPNIVRARVQEYLKFTRNMVLSEQRLVLAQGVFPLLGALIETFRRRLGREPLVAVPNGSYGPIYPLIAYHGGTVVPIETDPEQGFLLTLQAIARMSEKPDLLWLTQPNNPSGLYFDSDTVAGIMQLCSERGIYVLADEVFFLLSDPRLGEWTNPQLSFSSAYQSAEGKWLFLVDGLSKAFAAGGLRCGFAACPDESWANDLQAVAPLPPSSTLRAWDSLYSVFAEDPPHNMFDPARELADLQGYMHSARALLHEQRERLQGLLAPYGLTDGLENAKRGGIFLLARLADKQEKLARQYGLLVNPEQWARTAGWSRVCFSLEPARFAAAASRLAEFLKNEYPA